MTAQFAVLASGSGGNSAVVYCGDFGLLIDCGVGRRTLAGRLARCRLTWRHIQAVIFTHTHSDHWSDTSLAAILEHRIAVYCHSEHAAQLSRMSRTFPGLISAGLVRSYSANAWLGLRTMRLLPMQLPHDGGPAFGFRIEGPSGLFGPDWAIGFAADLGSWNQEIAEALADVDLLAIEFNHDEELQRNSGRPKKLIDRIMGNHGHLSNGQATELLRAVRGHSSNIDLRFVVTLHRSEQCNRPELVETAALDGLGDLGGRIEVHIAEQDVPTSLLHLSRKLPHATRPRSRRGRGPSSGFFNGSPGADH